MTASLLFVVVAQLGVTAVVATTAAFGARLGTAVTAGVVVGQALLLLQAGVAAGTLASGHRPASLGLHVAYVAVSVALLPLFLGFAARSPATGRADRWDHAAAATACVLSAVLSARVHETWRPA